MLFTNNQTISTSLIPPIDAVAPTKTEMATFALG